MHLNDSGIALANRFHSDFINEKRLDLLPEIFHQQVTVQGPQTTIIGLDELRAVFYGMFRAFPDLHQTVEYCLAEDGRAITRAVSRGQFSANWGRLRATHRRMSIPALFVFRMSDGRILDLECMFDMRTLVSQLAYVPPIGLQDYFNPVAYKRV